MFGENSNKNKLKKIRSLFIQATKIKDEQAAMLAKMKEEQIKHLNIIRKKEKEGEKIEEEINMLGREVEEGEIVLEGNKMIKIKEGRVVMDDGSGKVQPVTQPVQETQDAQEAEEFMQQQEAPAQQPQPQPAMPQPQPAVQQQQFYQKQQSQIAAHIDMSNGESLDFIVGTDPEAVRAWAEVISKAIATQQAFTIDGARFINGRHIVYFEFGVTGVQQEQGE